MASIAAGVAAHATQKKREDVGSLLVDYLHTSLNTLRQQGEAFADRAWLAQTGRRGARGPCTGS